MRVPDGVDELAPVEFLRGIGLFVAAGLEEDNVHAFGGKRAGKRQSRRPCADDGDIAGKAAVRNVGK